VKVKGGASGAAQGRRVVAGDASRAREEAAGRETRGKEGVRVTLGGSRVGAHEPLLASRARPDFNTHIHHTANVPLRTTQPKDRTLHTKAVESPSTVRQARHWKTSGAGRGAVDTSSSTSADASAGGACASAAAAPILWLRMKGAYFERRGP
jgi:hypothetical protein